MFLFERASLPGVPKVAATGIGFSRWGNEPQGLKAMFIAETLARLKRALSKLLQDFDPQA